MKSLMPPIPVLCAGVLCPTQTNSHTQSNDIPNLIDDAFIRDHELVTDRVSMNETDCTLNVRDRKYVCCSHHHLNIKY